jgi:hypothetical protein
MSRGPPSRYAQRCDTFCSAVIFKKFGQRVPAAF